MLIQGSIGAVLSTSVLYSVHEPIRESKVKKLSVRFLVLLLSPALILMSGCERPEEPQVAEQPDAQLDEGIEESVETEQAEKDEEIAKGDKSLVEKARELAKLRAEIEKNPETIDELLEKWKLNEDELEDLLFEIAEDPEASAAYAEMK